ncbi:hypothetical protein [Kitasatospora sp. NPDC088351]|uniref:recombination directionality factor n=1 Tax=Kitasatospora sp. NPDC088351 TaxID=3155180 RepID=UPI00341CC7DC
MRTRSNSAPRQGCPFPAYAHHRPGGSASNLTGRRFREKELLTVAGRGQGSDRGSESQSDYVGRFRAGRLVDNRPQSLDAWRVTMASPDVAAGVASLLGGEPVEWETTAEDSLEVLTDYDTVRITVEGPSAVQARMLLFGYKGQVLHDCDGARLLAPEADADKPCGCPESIEERRLAAKSGRGPLPSIGIGFKLAEKPALGRFRFVSSSWELAKTVADFQRALTETDGPTTCDLALELVELTTASGVAVRYRKTGRPRTG